MPRVSRRGLRHIDKEVGATLRAIRVRRGLSQMVLAKRLGVTFQQIQKYEAGSNAIASTRMPDLCAALGITPNDLFGHRYRFDGETADGSPMPPLSVRAVKLATKLDQLSLPMIMAISRLASAMLDLRDEENGQPASRHAR